MAVKWPTLAQLKAKARGLLDKTGDDLEGQVGKQVEVAAEAAALDVGWAIVKRLGIFSAGVAAAATVAAVTSPSTTQLSPGLSLVRYVDQHAPAYRVDPAAELAITTMEGASGGIGDNGTSFGPNQLHYGGALPASVYYGPYSARTQDWAWSSTGVDFVLREEGKLCGHLHGYRAVSCLAYRFERSANPARETAGAWAAYPAYAHGRTVLPPKRLPKRVRSTVRWFHRYFHIPIASFNRTVVTFRPQRHKPTFAPWRLQRMRAWARGHEHIVHSSRHRIEVRFQ